MVPRTDTEEITESGDASTGAARRRRAGRRWDVAALVGFLAAAGYLTVRLWQDVPGTRLGANPSDQAFFEWMLAYGVRVVSRLANPFFTDLMNAPNSVNLMANTSILGLSIPLSPVTLLFGAHVSFTLLLTLAFAATGLAWYYVLSRHFVTSRAAAVLGATFCAFAPGMVSHGNGHPNIVAQFLVPFIILWTLKLREPGGTVRKGVILGLLVTWQAFINEEILLLTALGIGLFVLVMAILRRDLWRQARPFLFGLGVAAAVAVVLLAYPLWMQFFGPGSYRGLRPDIKEYGADLASFPAFSRRSLAGTGEAARRLTQNPTEENAFLGWPLLVLLLGLLVWLRRNPVAVALGVVTLAFAAVSLGPKIRVHGDPVVRGPWWVLRKVPLFDSIVPTRLALALVPPIGLLLAIAWDRWRASGSTTRARPAWLRYAFPVAVLAALVPIAPTPLWGKPREPTPALLVNGRLLEYLSGDRPVVFVPPPRNPYPEPMAWDADAKLSFRMTHGYFLGPVTDARHPHDRYAILTSPPRETSDILYRVQVAGKEPAITPEMRSQAIEDLRFWRAAVLVLVPGKYADALRRTTSALVGFEPQWVDGAWLWDVRQLAGG